MITRPGASRMAQPLPDSAMMANRRVADERSPAAERDRLVFYVRFYLLRRRQLAIAVKTIPVASMPIVPGSGTWASGE